MLGEKFAMRGGMPFRYLFPTLAFNSLSFLFPVSWTRRGRKQVLRVGIVTSTERDDAVGHRKGWGEWGESGAKVCALFGAARAVSVSWFATATWRAVDV